MFAFTRPAVTQPLVVNLSIRNPDSLVELSVQPSEMELVVWFDCTNEDGETGRLPLRNRRFSSDSNQRLHTLVIYNSTEAVIFPCKFNSLAYQQCSLAGLQENYWGLPNPPKMPVPADPTRFLRTMVSPAQAPDCPNAASIPSVSNRRVKQQVGEVVAEEPRPPVGDEGEEERAGGAKGRPAVGHGVTSMPPSRREVEGGSAMRKWSAGVPADPTGLQDLFYR